MSEVELILRFALGGIFFPAGVAKLVRREQFRQAVSDYELLPPASIGVFSVATATAELLIGGFLLAGVFVELAALSAACLLVVFSTAIGANLVRGRRVGCGCLGTISAHEISALALLRNAVLLIACLVVLRHSSFAAFVGIGTPAPHGTESHGLAMLVGATLGVVAWSIVEEAARVRKLQQAFLRLQAER